MVVTIIIGGMVQCEIYSQIVLVADYLCKNLPNFCYERIEKSVLDWESWLCKVNTTNNWHHIGSPIIWKELLMKGSTPYYIGGAPEFLEYCHAYYNFDLFMGIEKYEGLVRNFAQFKKKMKTEELDTREEFQETVYLNVDEKKSFVVCISGASCPITRHLISRLLDLSNGERSISKVYIYDEDCSNEFLEYIETESSYVASKYPGKVVKFTDKIGNALTCSDLLIVLDHIPFDPEKSIGEWLYANMRLMQGLAIMINASASRSMYIILANLGPACFNATVLMHSVTINVRNIVVATCDLGLEVVGNLAEVCEVSSRTIFCPPVWGFTGINHLVDIKTTVHKYNSFDPYNRYTKVYNSSLCVGTVEPDMRTMEYLTFFDKSMWINVAETKKKIPEGVIPINKAVSILNLIRIWLLESSPPDYIICLGVLCDGTFGLTFDGAFSQPVRLYGREWRPCADFFLPRDNQMKLSYLEQIARYVMKLGRKDLPPLKPFYPCKCKQTEYKKKGVW